MIMSVTSIEIDEKKESEIESGHRMMAGWLVHHHHHYSFQFWLWTKRLTTTNDDLKMFVVCSFVV